MRTSFYRLCGACLLLCLFLTALGCRLSPHPDAASARVITPTPTAAPTATPSPVPTPSPTPSPTPTPSGLLGGRYAQLLTEETVGTETSYGCLSRYVSVTTVSQDPAYAQSASGEVTYFVADVYVQNVEDLRTEAAESDFTPTLRKAASVARMAERVNAIIAVSGDYHIHDNKGVIVRNGELYRSTASTRKDICVLYRDGTMRTYLVGTYDLDVILADDPWQIWSFGPALLDENGQVMDSFNSTLTRANPRCAIGYFEPGHYCFVVVDGRQNGYSDGVTMKNLSRLMHGLGCVAAYNLDGGASAQMYWNGEIVNSPSKGGRNISDIIYVAFPAE